MRKNNKISNFRYKKPFVSSYKKDNFRSYYFKGVWVRHYINEVAKNLKRGESIYKIMWKYAREKHEHMPQKIYKFFPCSINSLYCIENKCVHLSIPNDFNDPYDCYITSDKLDFLKRYILEKIKNEHLVENGELTQGQFRGLLQSVCFDADKRNYLQKPKTIEQMLYSIHQCDHNSQIYKLQNEALKLYKGTARELRNNSIRVVSFSALDEKKLSSYMEMWGHYADSHRGFCIEYDLSEFMNIDSYEFGYNDTNAVLGSFLPCIYTSNPNVIPRKYIYNYAVKKALTKYDHVQYEKNIIKAFITKSSAWSYENEWRIILPREYCDIYNNLISFPYASKIYMGYRIKENHRKIIYTIAKRLNIKVYETDLREDSFELDFSNANIDVHEEYENLVQERKRRKFLSE